MTKFMISEIIGFASTDVEAQKIATQHRMANPGEHVKYHVEGEIHCDQRNGTPLSEKWWVEVWRHPNSGKVHKFAYLPF